MTEILPSRTSKSVLGRVLTKYEGVKNLFGVNCNSDGDIITLVRFPLNTTDLVGVKYDVDIGLSILLIYSVFASIPCLTYNSPTRRPQHKTNSPL